MLTIYAQENLLRNKQCLFFQAVNLCGGLSHINSLLRYNGIVLHIRDNNMLNVSKNLLRRINKTS